MAWGRDIGPDEHIHKRFAHRHLALVEPHTHIVHARPGERLGHGGIQAFGIVGKVDRRDASQRLASRAFLVVLRTDLRFGRCPSSIPLCVRYIPTWLACESLLRFCQPSVD